MCLKFPFQKYKILSKKKSNQANKINAGMMKNVRGDNKQEDSSSVSDSSIFVKHE